VNTILHTERLVLRPFVAEDFEAFAAMCADPRVMEFLAEDGQPLSRFGAWRALAGIVGHWTLFAVEERASGTFIGRIGPCEPEGWPDFEIGWTLRSDAHQQLHRTREYALDSGRRTRR
jgi:RimJ/RimL family protein N-acetyltransferase